VRSVGAMLTELESLWRGRISRIDELIAAPEPHTQQAPTPHHAEKD
jgi:hypothetical protein